MSVETSEPVGSRPRKGKAARPPASPPAGKVAKVKTTIHISPQAAERLGVHALKAGMDRSAYLEGLIMQHCRRWIVSDRAGRAAGEALPGTETRPPE